MHIYTANDYSAAKSLMVFLAKGDPDYWDCGELNCTKLAEDACDSLGLYDGDDIPEWLFEMSAELSDKLEPM